MDSLPIEILTLIFLFLSERDIINCRCINKIFYRASHDNSLIHFKQSIDMPLVIKYDCILSFQYICTSIYNYGSTFHDRINNIIYSIQVPECMISVTKDSTYFYSLWNDALLECCKYGRKAIMYKLIDFGVCEIKKAMEIALQYNHLDMYNYLLKI